MDTHTLQTADNELARNTTRDSDRFIISLDDRILVTGAAGFIGRRVVDDLVSRGFRNILCFCRHSGDADGLEAGIRSRGAADRVEIFKGNLLSRADCERACKDVKVILHLAAGTGQKSFPDAVLNSVVTTRNLLDVSLAVPEFRRFVLVSSFAVYSNRQASNCLDESCPIEEKAEVRGDAYCYAKVKQEKILKEYASRYGNRYVIVRPGSVYGGRKKDITGRVGLGTFGLFLHLGGSNAVPFTYVDNCAAAIALAGLVPDVDGEVFNVVDDDVLSSREFLRLYKKNVRPFKSVYLPKPVSYLFCYLWEKYSQRSKGQLPQAFNRSHWYSLWRNTRYSNQHLKRRLGWTPVISTSEAMRRYLSDCGPRQSNA